MKFVRPFFYAYLGIFFSGFLTSCVSHSVEKGTSEISEKYPFETSQIETPEGRGAELPFKTYQAEKAITNGTVLPPLRTISSVTSEASGRSGVVLKRPGDFVEFRLEKPANGFVVRYSIPDGNSGKGIDLPLSIYVNGKKIFDVTLTSAYSWVYGKYPWTNNSSDGGPHKFFDEERFMTDLLPTGTLLRLQKDDGNVFDYTIDLLDAEAVTPPLLQPTGSLSVMDFGATPDDGIDDTEALQKALDAGAKQSRTIWIPKGVYNVSADSELYLTQTVLQGAGIWYSRIRFGKTAFFGQNKTFLVRDLSLQGCATQRDDQSDENGFKGSAGTGSRFENVWFDRFKVGIWSEDLSDGLVIKSCRFRNLLADGVNLCLGTRNSIVENSHFRGTGDDAIASWSAQYRKGVGPCNGNVIRRNTIESPWLANGIALYGGQNHLVEDNLVFDTVLNGGGIELSTDFNPIPFGGRVVLRNNTLVRCGSFRDYSGVQPGALNIMATAQDIGAPIVIDGLDVWDSTGAALSIDGPSVLVDATFSNLHLVRSGRNGLFISRSAGGNAVFSTTVVEESKASALSREGGLSIKKLEGNQGW